MVAYKGYPGFRADLRAQPYSDQCVEQPAAPPHSSHSSLDSAHLISTGSLQSLARDSTFKMRITLSPCSRRNRRSGVENMHLAHL